MLAMEARVEKVRKKRLQLVRIHGVYPQGCELFALEDGGWIALLGGGLVAPLVLNAYWRDTKDAISFE